MPLPRRVSVDVSHGGLEARVAHQVAPGVRDLHQDARADAVTTQVISAEIELTGRARAVAS
jgi:hypothetical protein